MIIAVIMDYLVCHEVEYSERKDPIFAGLISPVLTRRAREEFRQNISILAKDITQYLTK